MAKFEEQLLTRADLGISQFSASGWQYLGDNGVRGSCKSESIPILWKRPHTPPLHIPDILYTLSQTGPHIRTVGNLTFIFAFQNEPANKTGGRGWWTGRQGCSKTYYICSVWLRTWARWTRQSSSAPRCSGTASSWYLSQKTCASVQLSASRCLPVHQTCWVSQIWVMKLAFVPTSHSHPSLCKGLCLQYGPITHLPLSGILCVRSREPVAHLSPRLHEICCAASHKWEKL